MSSVAVLTPESFAEHRSGLKDQEITGNHSSPFGFLTSTAPLYSFQIVAVSPPPCLLFLYRPRWARLRPGG